MSRKYFILIIVLGCWINTYSQINRNLYPSSSNARSFKIPFEYENDFIIVKLVFNNLFPLNFIFDTGAEHTILTKREVTDLMKVNYQRKFSVLGADLKTILYAYLATNINIRLNDLHATNRTILVLEEDYFRFEELAGVNVQGILGADFFRRFVVKINYQRQVITLYDPRYFPPPDKDKYTELPIEIDRNKPYLFGRTQFPNDTTVAVKLLVDSGAGVSLLLYTNTHPDLHLPEKVIKSPIARGLGGNLEGFVGRVEQLEIADLQLNSVTTSFQDLPEGIDTTFLNGRNGTVGNLILNRFTVIIDYLREKIYLKPEQNYDEKFKFDRSGLSISATGPTLTDFIVYYVVPGSPADEAGVLPGDEIRRINWWPAGFFSLDDIYKKLKKREGKKIKLVLKRGDKKLKVKFYLRDLI